MFHNYILNNQSLGSISFQKVINNKLRNIEIIQDGGWHFTNIKNPKDLLIKLNNFGHHNEFEVSGITLEKLKEQIDNKIVNYNHFADKTEINKYKFEYKLKNINLNLLPQYLRENKYKYEEWFD